jgi:hypothetical protein
MSGRDGSVWIEDDFFCFIDENGDEKCLDFELVRSRLTALETDVDELEKDTAGQDEILRERIIVVDIPDTFPDSVMIFHEGEEDRQDGITVSGADDWAEVVGDEIHLTKKSNT